MAKKPDDPKMSDKPQGGPAIRQHHQLAMGMKPNTGCGTGPKTKQ